MKFVALVSGGKDSIYSIIECIRNGHELIGCVHLGAPETQVEEESYMYQTAASEVITTLVEECLGVPLILYPRVGKSINTSLVYEGRDDQQDNKNEQEEEEDEVEDLYRALQIAKERFHDNDTPFQGVSSGAILSTYQRVRIENVCHRLGLISLSYLWRKSSQHELLSEMLQNDTIIAVLVRTACPPGLVPKKHLNQTLQTLATPQSQGGKGLFQQLNNRYQFHVCGEGGEYESLVIDSCIYKKRLILDEVEITFESDIDDSIGNLKILKCHSEQKEEEEETDTEVVSATSSASTKTIPTVTKTTTTTTTTTKTLQTPINVTPTKTTTTFPTPVVYLPQIQRGTGGIWHISELLAPVPAHCRTVGTTTGTTNASSNDENNNDDDKEAHYAVQEALEIFDALHQVLQSNSATAQDVMMVHLYLSEISHFAKINTHYRDFFGTVLPPSRSCVAVGCNVLPGGRRVQLDCLIQSGSGQYMRKKNATIPVGVPTSTSDSNKVTSAISPYTTAAYACQTSTLREVLHVQSISHWAPVCVGPYSQVNTLRSGLHFLAGQIGLNPPTMTLVEGGWTAQLHQCWKNIASVLDALDGSNGGCLDHIVSGLVYVADHIYRQSDTLASIESICRDQMIDNAGIVPGRIDATQAETTSSTLYGGYEDEETWRAENGMDGEDEPRKIKEHCPLLVVSIPTMPVGAIVEVEVIAATAKAASTLGINDTCLSRTNIFASTTATQNDTKENSRLLGWDSGHDFPETARPVNDNVQIDGTMRFIGKGCAAAVIVTASSRNNIESSDVAGGAALSRQLDADALLCDMLATVDKVLAEGRSGLDTAHALHVRLYHVATTDQSSLGGTISLVVKDDGTRLRSSLQSCIASWRKGGSCPSSTVVPVQAMTLIPSRPTVDAGNEGLGTFLAMQVLVVDPVHLETELWINQGREYY